MKRVATKKSAENSFSIYRVAISACFTFLLAGHAGADSLSNADQQPIYLADASSQIAVMDAVIVSATAVSNAQDAKTRLDSVAGGTSVVDAAEVAKGRTATIQDILAYQPGVFAQSVGGNEAAKISIRGSGANTSPGYFREGIKYMFDGLALSGPGGTPYELLGASGASYTEVLRGANAFEYGALSLGGAINFVTNTGKTAPGARVRLESGSWGYQRESLSGGASSDDGDIYVNVDNFRSDGYRHYSFARARGAVANLGYNITPDVDTRLLVRYREEFHEDPGALTFAQYDADPQQGSPSNISNRNSGTRHGTTWIGSKTTVKLDGDSWLEFGAAYHNYPHTNSRYSPGLPNWWQWHDLNLSLRYFRDDQLFGLESQSTIAVFSTQHLKGETVGKNGVTRVTQKGVDYKGSYDRVISFGNDLAIAEDWWLSSGVSFVNVRRKTSVDYVTPANTTAFPDSEDYDNWSAAPRLGFRYQIVPTLQLFGNASRSIDPPVSWQYSSSSPSIAYVKPLVEQKANTVEFGIRGSTESLDGSFVLYRSWVKDELLNVEFLTATATTAAVTTAFNASPTIHQGVEANLTAKLWQSENDDALILRQAYTYNDFRYDNDDAFGDSILPSLPKHFYQAALEYQQNSGFYAGINVSSVSKTAVDYSNSLFAPSYTIFGATVGYAAAEDKWKVFLDLKNITDKDNVVTVNPLYDAKGKDSASLYPGDGFDIYGGLSFNFY